MAQSMYDLSADLTRQVPDLALVDGDNVLRNPVVQHIIRLVDHHVQQIKPAIFILCQALG